MGGLTLTAYYVIKPRPELLQQLASRSEEYEGYFEPEITSRKEGRSRTW